MTATRLPATTLFLTERIGRRRLRLALTRLLRGDRLPAAVWPQALRLRWRAWELTGRMAALGVRRRLAMISHADVVRDVRRGLRCELDGRRCPEGSHRHRRWHRAMVAIRDYSGRWTWSPTFVGNAFWAILANVSPTGSTTSSQYLLPSPGFK